MLQLNFTFIVLLAGLLQYSHGKQELMSCIVAKDVDKRENTLCSDSCDQKTDCLCHSFHCALQKVNLSSNIMINITNDVELSSVEQLMDFNNISIVGLNNPVVKCSNTGALHVTSCYSITVEGIIWEKCGSNNTYALDIQNCSVVTIKNSSFRYSTGPSLALKNNSTIDNCTFLGNSFDGHGVAIYYDSSVDEDNTLVVSNCEFSNNTGKSVAYIHGKSGHEKWLHLKNSNFYLNQAVPLYAMNHDICIGGNVSYNSNKAQNGGGIFMSGNAVLKFLNNSNVEFSNNSAKLGSAIYINSSSIINFVEESAVNFINNIAMKHGAVYLNNKSTFICKECKILFKHNKANVGGAIYHLNSNITFTGSSDIRFDANKATFRGGAIFSRNSSLIVEGNSSVQFTKNKADFGGAMYIAMKSNVMFQNSSVVMIYNNIAYGSGAAIYLYSKSDVTFKGSCNITFGYNQCLQVGGAVYAYRSMANFADDSVVLFHNNSAIFGGAVGVALKSMVDFKGRGKVLFINNMANHGGALFFYYNSTIAFKNKQSVEFEKNHAHQGGALASHTDSHIIADEECNLKFDRNTAHYGGVFYSSKSTAIFTENSSVTLNDNRAFIDGGVVYLTSGSLIMLHSHRYINFSINKADDYGKIFYINHNGKISINTTNLNINNSKTTPKESLFYINVQEKNCNDTCLKNYIAIENMSNECLQDIITTSPSRLELRDPAKCIDNKDNSTCDQYYINDIMLGQEIIVNGCVMDYYNHSAETARLLDISSYNESYHIDGSDNVLISCNHTFQGFRVTGNITKLSNISMNLTLHFDRNSESNSISVNLTVELSPCHPGFVYNPSSQICECYNTGDIVSCSGSSSTIRRGYWFGSVNGKSTVAYCPVNYCNFTCCETTNGIYHLSPMRKDQCALNRDGTACGSCKEGYTLSFDSARCIQLDMCTATMTVVIIISTVLYWLVVVIVVFFLMHYQVAIGYLYAIIYYYSMLDLLLSHMHNVYISEKLYTTVNVMSSITKLLPQFLGQLCFTQSMNEIDQQIIHYIHPLAISFILVMISLSARCSYRVSSFISKDIIRVICLLLLLSYTSVATTSLLLLQPLKFLDVDKTYTYLSPGIQYFEGRHLGYGLVAILCTIVIVIGLPLLLSLEPFLNRRFSFVKIKPFLDQFQGCYKNKYRCFAGYYMICRLITIMIIMIDSSVDFPGHYVLIIAYTIMVLIHLIARPYASNILNVFDGIILQLLSFIVSAFYFHDPYSSLVAVIICILVIVPMILFCMMELFVYREKIKKLITALACKSSKNTFNVNTTDVSINNFDLVIGNTFRISRGVTVCEM